MTSCKPVSFSRRTLHHGVSKYLDFSVIDNEFVHQLSSRVNVSGTLPQQTEAVKLLLDACINIIFLLTTFTATFRPKAAEIEKS